MNNDNELTLFERVYAIPRFKQLGMHAVVWFAFKHDLSVFYPLG